MLLKKPVTFTGAGGQTDESFEAQVNCHTSSAFRQALYFRNVFAKAFMDMAERSRDSKANKATEVVEETPLKDGEIPKLDAATVRLVLTTSDIDMEELLGRFDKLIYTGVVSVNGKPLNYKQLAEIDPEDVEGLLVIYLSNFITPLVMKALTMPK